YLKEHKTKFKPLVVLFKITASRYFYETLILSKLSLRLSVISIFYSSNHLTWNLFLLFVVLTKPEFKVEKGAIFNVTAIMMATSQPFSPEENLSHPSPIFSQQINTKQAVIYNKSGTKCMNIVKEPSGMTLSPTSPSRDPGEHTPSHNPQNDHIEDPDVVNGTHNPHTKSNVIYMSSGEEAGDILLPEIITTQISDIHSHHNHNHKSRKDGIWNTNNNEERQRIREFWLQLGEEERRSLVKVEKEAVLKKMKEQQKHSCGRSIAYKVAGEGG
ncbi:13075_t:CDS:2, partial [Acaulospora morrowiae]